SNASSRSGKPRSPIGPTGSVAVADPSRFPASLRAIGGKIGRGRSGPRHRTREEQRWVASRIVLVAETPIGGSAVFAMMAFAIMVATVPMAAVGAIVVVRIATMVAVVVMVVGVVVSVRTLTPVVRRAGRQPAGQLLHAAGLLAARRVRGRLRRGRARGRRCRRRSK